MIRFQGSVFAVSMSEGHLWCVHAIRFSELTKNLQFCAKMIMQNLSVPFIFQGDCRMKIEHVLFPSVFSKLRNRLMESHFYCVHTIRFSEATKIGTLKTDRVNGPLFSEKFLLFLLRC